jgi:GT2 family glycosyltransferase
VTVATPISVVIPTFQRRAATQRALLALARQTVPAADYEVIVSIDGSEDGTREMVAGFPAPYALRAVWRPNQGRAGACNAGIRAARGALVVLLDDDMEAAPGLLAAHQRAHAGAPARGVIGAVPVVPAQPAQPLAEYVRAGFERRLAKLARSDYSIQFYDVYTGNFSIRRATLLEVGAFDDEFRHYGHEDYELALRLLRAGVELVYRADALAHHHYDKDFAAVARDSIGRGRNDVLFVAKHPEARAYLRLGRARGSRQRRLLCRALLGLNDFVPRLPDWIVVAIRRLEQRRSTRLDACYDFALDYFYWLGAKAARRERLSAT